MVYCTAWLFLSETTLFHLPVLHWFLQKPIRGPKNRQPGAYSCSGQRGPVSRVTANTDTYLNKQSRKRFQGWSGMNNPQAKVSTTVPRAAWQQGVVFYTVSLGTQATSQSIGCTICTIEIWRHILNNSAFFLLTWCETSQIYAPFINENKMKQREILLRFSIIIVVLSPFHFAIFICS